MTNPFEEFFGGLGNALDKAMNPKPTDAAVYEKDGALHLKLIYGDTSGGDVNICLPDKDLRSIQAGIVNYLLDKGK